MKEMYQGLEIKIVRFSNDDVITGSPATGTTFFGGSSTEESWQVDPF